jgi:hypothetical protein
MAINIPIVTDFNSKGLQDAQNAFTNFRTKIGEADGAMGKMKAGFGAAMDTMKANAGAFAAAAGAAILGFAVKAIGEFQDLALAAGKFADSTNVAVEEASAFIEVAGDLGIEASVIEKSINKMNLAIAKGGKEFNALGVEIAYNEKGLIDTNETFLRTVDAINSIADGTVKTQYATAVFGKSWMEMSELVKMGSSGLRAALRSVSQEKIINPDELRKARELRAAQDALGDAFQDVALKVGSVLVPALTRLLELTAPLFNGLEYVAKGARMVGDALNPLDSIMSGVERVTDSSASAWERGYGAIQTLGGAIPGVNVALDALGGWLFGSKKEADKTVKSFDYLTDSFFKNQSRAQQLRYEAAKLGNTISVLDEDTNGLIDTFDSLLAQFDRDELVTGLKDKFAEFQKTVLEALGKATPEAAAKSEAAMRDLVREMGQVAQSARLTSQEQVKIVALLEKGQYDAAYQELLRQIAAVPRQIPVEFIGSVSGIPVPAGGQTPSETTGRGGLPPGFGGLPNVGGGKSGATPTRPIVGRFNLMPTSSAGTNVTVNVAGSVTSENDLVESIRKGLVNAQRNGSGLVYANF